MMKLVFKLLKIYILCFQSICCFSQESTWQWINPYPLPFFTSRVEGVNNQNYIWNKFNELYRRLDDGSYQFIETPLPQFSGSYIIDRKEEHFFIVNDSYWYFYHQALGNFYTTNGGESYTETEFTSNGYHINLQAIEESKLIAIAQGETILDTKLLVTENSGESWESIYNNEGTIKPLLVSIDTILAISNDTIFHSFDKGQTWTKGSECKGCYNMTFENNKLYISSNTDKIFLSEDFGLSYIFLYEFEHNWAQGGIFGLTSEFDIEESVGCATSAQRLFVTEDSGQTFQYYDFLLPFNINNNGCKVIDKKIFIDTYIGGINTIVEFDVETKEFENIFSNGLYNLKNFHVVQDTVYILTSHSNYGDRRNIHISYDKGYSWETKLLPQNDLIELAYRNNYGIDFVENDSCIFVSNDRIFKAGYPYDDWLEYSSPIDTFTQAIQFYNTNDGLLVDIFQNIYKTEDQGKSWQKVVQLDQEFAFVDMYTSDEFEKSYILQQPISEVNKSKLYEFEEGSLQDSIIFFDKREDYHGGIVYQDSILYLSFYNNTYKVEMSTNQVEKLCDLAHGKIVHIDSDTLWVKNEGILYKMDENCQVYSSDTFSYSRNVSSGYVNPLDLIELYVDDTGEAFGYYPKGYMLKYTDNFREDLLVGVEETIFPKSVDEKKDIYLFPNPTNGILQLNTSLQKPTIFLYASDGKRVGTYYENAFYLSDKLQGLYYYTILEDGKYVTTGKIIVE